jgi:hypothetical protein
MTTGSHIYALLDPLTFTPRYIGRTANSLGKRLSQHLADTKLRQKTALAGWLRELVAAGQKPPIALLDTVDNEEWRQAEREWIARLQAEGIALLNQSDGGTGPEGGYRWTEEGIERLRRARAGRAFGGSSRFPGVAYHRGSGKWRAQLCGAWLGLHDTEEAAFTVYRAAFRDRFQADVPEWEGWTPAERLDEIGEPRPTPKQV